MYSTHGNEDESVKNMYSNMNLGKREDQFASSINSLLDDQARQEGAATSRDD